MPDLEEEEEVGGSEAHGGSTTLMTPLVWVTLSGRTGVYCLLSPLFDLTE